MLLVSTFFTLFYFSCLSTANPVQQNGEEWWQHAVIYQIYPRSFKDSNNTGTGDLNGIISKLDHLVDAGVTALWLSPIYKSPQVDFGYDISDFKDVDEIFGDLDIFKNLVKQAHSKGLKVVLDFVPNHSSDLHEWFGKSENREPGYEDYYVWVDGSPEKPPNSWQSIFHGPAWTYSHKRNQYYLHQFASAQPDLNYRNPKVVQEMKDVLTFWLDLGVDGFRVDIISALFEDKNFPDGPLPDHVYRNDQPETYDMVYQWRILLDEYQATHGGETRVMMTESYAEAEQLFPYYGNATHNGAHFTFNFWFITKLNKDSSANDFKNVIDSWLDNMKDKYTADWVLGNHDQHRVATRYGPERLDGMNMIAMLLPGVTVTYNGEEIGMENGWVSWEEGVDPQGCNGNQGDWEHNSRDFERTPFQWDDTDNAGFNEGHQTWLPVASNYKNLNLANQKVDGLKSHYRIYQQLIKAKQSPTAKYGEVETQVLNNNVLVITRTLKDEQMYVVLVNFKGQKEVVTLDGVNGIPDSLFVRIPSLSSSKNSGARIHTKLLTLYPYEALVLVS